ncbi:MAG: TolC family protein [Candidatus Omnitrophica bacterium]|nr:TolC family protein [Candidatus Omnitrophota bacterium]
MKKFALFLLIGVVGTAPAFADGALSWQDCVTEARQHNPDLVSAKEKLHGAQAEKAVTRSGILPQVSTNASTSTDKAEDRDKTKTYSYGVTAKQLLFDGFKSVYDLSSADQNIKAAAYNYEITSSNVRLNLWSAYVGLLYAQESLNVTKDIVARRKQNLDLVQLQYDGGKEHKGSLLTAKANLAQAQFEVEQAARNVELYQRRLHKQLGRENFTPITASGDLIIRDIDTEKPVFETLVDATPLLKQLVAEKESARLGLKSSQAALFPEVYANASAGKSDNVWPPQARSWSAGFSVSFPIFQGGLQQAGISKARAGFEQAKADMRSGRDGVILTLAETWTQWQDAVAQARIQEQFLEASRERARITEAQYSSGLSTFNDWSLIEDALVSNEKAVLQAKASAFTSEASWLQAKGETLDE